MENTGLFRDCWNQRSHREYGFYGHPLYFGRIPVRLYVVPLHYCTTQASRAKRRRNAYAQSAVTLAERQEILARFRQATAQQKRLSVLDAQKAELFRLFVEHGSETRAGVGLDSIDRSELRFLMRRTAVLLNVRGIGSHLEHDLAPEYVLGDVVAYLLHVARDDPHFTCMIEHRQPFFSELDDRVLKGIWLRHQMTI